MVLVLCIAGRSRSLRFENNNFIYIPGYRVVMETVTIPKEEYDYLKRLEEAAQEQLLSSIKRGLEDAAKGRLRER